MDEVELSLRTLVSDEDSFRLLMLMLNLVLTRDAGIHFDQSELISADEFKQHDKLTPFILRFNGLCELVSNIVIADNLMGSSNQSIIRISQCVDLNTERLNVEKINDQTIQLIYKTLLNHANNPYKEKLSLMHLDAYSTTHTLDCVSYFQQMNAYLFGIYPFDLFSYGEQVQIDQEVNPLVLKIKLESLADESYIKFMAFQKSLLGFSGHAMVIKKTGESFSFFDPNVGEKFNLDLAQLCDCINRAMTLYDATHMAFLNGAEYVKNIIHPALPDEYRVVHEHGASTSMNQPESTDNGITLFILSEIKKIVEHQMPLDDRYFIDAMDNIRKGVEARVQQSRTFEDMSAKKIEQRSSFRYDRDKKSHKLRSIDDIRCKISRSYYNDLYKKYWGKLRAFVIKLDINFHDGLSTADLERITSVSGGSAEVDLFLNNLRTVLPQSVKSSYDLLTLLIDLHVEHCQIVCDLLQDRLPSIIQTTRHVSIVFSRINKEKQMIVYDAIKAHFPAMIKSAHDFSTLLSTCSPEQCTEIFEVMQEDLPGMIKSAGDLGDVFHYLTTEQRIIIFDKIRERLALILNAADDTSYDFQLALDALLPEQRPIVINILMTKLNNLCLESIDTFKRIHDYLAPEQAIMFREAMLDRLPSLMSNSGLYSNKMVEILTIDQFISVFQKYKAIASPRDALSYLLASDILHQDRQQGQLAPETCEILLEGIKEQIPDIVHSISDFYRILAKISPVNRAVVFEMMKDKFAVLVETTKDFAEILEFLSPEQCSTFVNGPVQQILELKFNNILSSQDAKTFAIALIGQDHTLIKTQFDHLIEISKDQNCSIFSSFSSIFSSFKEAKPVDKLVHAISELEPYWLEKINIALKLELTTYQMEYDKKLVQEQLQRYIDPISQLHTMKRNGSV